jgi:hypothetical protein
MNVKKYLKQQAQKDLQALRTDRDEEFLQRLKDSIEESAKERAPKTKHNKKWLWAIPSGALACAVAAILIVELVPFPNNGLGDTKYEEANFVHSDSDIIELSNALTNLTLNFTEDQTVDIAKITDSVSGDELYYALTIDDNSSTAFYSMRVMIVVNNKYHYDKFKIEDDFATEIYSDYSVIYRQQISVDVDTGLNVIEGSAKLVNTKYEIYVLTYKEYSFDNGMLLTIIDNTFDFK